MQDRLRKATEDNRELAATLRRDAEAALRQRSTQKPKKRAGGSDLNSFRDSEERQSSTGRGTKRARDAEIEKVRKLHVLVVMFDVFLICAFCFLRTVFPGFSVITMSKYRRSNSMRGHPLGL